LIEARLVTETTLWLEFREIVLPEYGLVINIDFPTRAVEQVFDRAPLECRYPVN
jgi:hypothetical protein